MHHLITCRHNSRFRPVIYDAGLRCAPCVATGSAKMNRRAPVGPRVGPRVGLSLVGPSLVGPCLVDESIVDEPYRDQTFAFFPSESLFIKSLAKFTSAAVSRLLASQWPAGSLAVSTLNITFSSYFFLSLFLFVIPDLIHNKHDVYNVCVCYFFPRDNALPWTHLLFPGSVSATCHRWWCWPLNWTILTGEESFCSWYCVRGKHYESGGTSNVFWLFLRGYFCKRNRLNKKFTAAMRCDVTFVYVRILTYGGRHF